MNWIRENWKIALMTLVGALGLYMLAMTLGVAAQAADKGGPKTADEDLMEVVRGFKPYIAIHGGAAAAYGDGSLTGLSISDGGFDAAALLNGSVGFTSQINEIYFWGLEANVERRLTSEESTPLSIVFKGGELKYTAAVDFIFGAALTKNLKAYTIAGYRYGWSEDITAPALTKDSFNVPKKAGPEVGLGISYNFNKNIVWDTRGLVWFPGDEDVKLGALPTKLNLESTELRFMTGLKFEF